MFDRDVYYDSVRASLFSGGMSQKQVDGQNAILDGWEQYLPTQDLRFLAYMLATTYHETSKEMQPIEEYGKGSGMSYGVPDPETKQTYYGRGFVQLTWRDNYHRADVEIGLTGDRSCEWHAENALDDDIAARVMWFGMYEGWFRKSSDGKPQTLPRYFNDTVEDPYGAREIINGDKSKVPSWSGGKSIGNLIVSYYQKFLSALHDAWHDEPAPTPVPPEENVVVSSLTLPPGTPYEIWVNAGQVVKGTAG